MTTLTHSPRRGLTWTVLRLHRMPLWIWTVLVIAGAGGLVWLHELGQSAPYVGPCGGTGMPRCGTAMSYGTSESFFAQLLAWLPCGITACAGAVLIGRELERGTVTLAWAQSVSPVRWLAAKLAVPAVALLSGTVALTLMFRWVWASGPDDGANRWNSEYFHAAGSVGPAYVLLGLALGALAAWFTRRALPAMALAVVGIVTACSSGRGLSCPQPAEVVSVC